MNRAAIFGRLTKDPVLKVTETQKTVANFVVAVQRNDLKTADFFSCVAFGKVAETIVKLFSKGSRILLEGAIRIDTYKKDNENKQSVKFVVSSFNFVDYKKTEDDTTKDDLDETDFDF